MKILTERQGRQLLSRNIPAIYTEYNWQFYRSQLEATWARFFDEHNIPFSYEPRGLGYWLPDFLISRGIRYSPYRTIKCLIEIKPSLDIARIEMSKHWGDIKHAWTQYQLWTWLFVGAPQIGEGKTILNTFVLNWEAIQGLELITLSEDDAILPQEFRIE